MPRIYDSTSSPIDYCRKCFPKTEEEALELHGNQGDGPDGRGNCFGWDEDHPDYDGEDYTCEKCRRRLTSRDNIFRLDKRR